MKKSGFAILLFWGASLVMLAQTPEIRGKDTARAEVLRMTQVGKDTLPVFDINAVKIYPKPVFKNKRQYRRYSRYVLNVKKVYPYAKYLGNLLPEMEQHLDSISTEQEKRKYVRSVEKDLKDRFEDDIWNMTISQGRILLKLIGRETGKNSYEILDELKGNFSASFWQTIARIFGSDLKTEYDPLGEDRLLNQIVIMIESGRI